MTFYYNFISIETSTKQSFYSVTQVFGVIHHFLTFVLFHIRRLHRFEELGVF